MLEDEAIVVDIVRLHGQLGHPLRDIGCRRQVEPFDLVEHVVLRCEVVVDDTHRAGCERHVV
jgi:hypothetical protein